jgi:hypothetical protein
MEGLYIPGLKTGVFCPSPLPVKIKWYSNPFSKSISSLQI